MDPDVGTVTLAIPSPREAIGQRPFDRGSAAGTIAASHLLHVQHRDWFSDVREAFDHPIRTGFSSSPRRTPRDVESDAQRAGIRTCACTARPTIRRRTCRRSRSPASAERQFRRAVLAPIGFTQNYFQVKDTLTATRARTASAPGRGARHLSFQDFHHTSVHLQLLEPAGFRRRRTLLGAARRRSTDRASPVRRTTIFRLLRSVRPGQLEDTPELTANLGLRYEVFTSRRWPIVHSRVAAGPWYNPIEQIRTQQRYRRTAVRHRLVEPGAAMA